MLLLGLCLRSLHLAAVDVLAKADRGEALA